MATLTTTTGTPALAFTLVLQLNADGTVSGSSMSFTLASPCFGANTTVTGQLSGSTLNLAVTSATASNAVNTLQMSLTVNAAATAMSGTFTVTPAAGATGCGAEAGTVSMVRQ